MVVVRWHDIDVAKKLFGPDPKKKIIGQQTRKTIHNTELIVRNVSDGNFAMPMVLSI